MVCWQPDISLSFTQRSVPETLLEKRADHEFLEIRKSIGKVAVQWWN